MEVAQSRMTLCDPMDCSLPGSSVHGILQARILEWVAVPFSRASSQIETRSPILQVDSLPSEPPKNTGVASLSLLQWIFSTQESNRSLLHFRQILNQLSYQGSLIICKVAFIIIQKLLGCIITKEFFCYIYNIGFVEKPEWDLI